MKYSSSPEDKWPLHEIFSMANMLGDLNYNDEYINDDIDDYLEYVSELYEDMIHLEECYARS